MQIFIGSVAYFYDDGIYYQPAGTVYQVVYPPVGAIVPVLPAGAYQLIVGSYVYYYAGGAFYMQQGNFFVVVNPPLGVVVPELPPGAAPIVVNGNVAYQFNTVCYQPVFVNGVTQYVTFVQ